VGSNWSEDITRAVRTSKGIICCISEHYVKSSLCTKEVLMAHDMGKVIIPLVLPSTEPKAQEWDLMVRAAYASTHPPHAVAREIAKTSWVDFRPFGKGGPDPTSADQFEQHFPVIAHLKRQLHNVKRKGCLWDLDGTWLLKFTQNPEDNEQKLTSFETHITLKHTKISLTGGGGLNAGAAKNLKVVVEGALLECSSLSFTLKFSNSEGQEEIIVRSMISVDGKSLEGKWTGVDVGDWCSGSGSVQGKLAREKKRTPK